MIWNDIETETQRLLDESGGRFHTTTEIRTYLEEGEALIACLRLLVEKTDNLSLTNGTPVYSIHSSFSDFYMPLRVTIGNDPLERTSLAALERLDNTWYGTASATPSHFFMIGATLMGFYKTPNTSLTAVVTYAAVPPTGVAGTSPPTIGIEWHHLLPLYAAAVLLGSEGDMAPAIEKLQEFIDGAGISRDLRFLKGSTMRPAETIEQPEKVATD